jgi:hypothetical protein
MVDTPDSKQDYLDRVTVLANAIEEEYRNDVAASVHAVIHERVDSSRLVTHHPGIVLRYYEHEPQEYMHAVHNSDSFRRVLTGLAYAALQHDIYLELQDRGVL